MKHCKQNKTDNYRQILGEEEWTRLHPAIQKRFSAPDYTKATTYSGIMNVVYLSTSGQIIAQLCRLIGTPLALYNGINIPTVVEVYPNRKLNGMTWDRHYHYPNRATCRVTSTKCMTNDIGLTEVVGYGLGMKLRIYEHQAGLYFESTRYFISLWKYRLPIPHFMTPGKTVVSQRAVDSENFEFALTVEHPILGNVFRQIGTFIEQKISDTEEEALHLKQGAKSSRDSSPKPSTEHPLVHHCPQGNNSVARPPR